MLLFDFIHDESPLLAEALRVLIHRGQLDPAQIAIITMARRWHEFFYDFSQHSMTRFFENLDNKPIDLDSELSRLSRSYQTTNLYTVDRLTIKKPGTWQKKMLVYTFIFYENLFSTDQVSHYFTTGIAYMYNLVSYQVAQHYHIKHISFYDIRYPYEKRVTVSYGTINRFDRVLADYRKYTPERVSSEMMQRLNRFRDQPRQPMYLANLINRQTINTILVREFFIRFKKYFLEKDSRYDYFSRNPFILAYEKLRKFTFAKIITLLSRRLFDHPDLSKDKFFLFPIHMHPEASTLVLAPYYVNQLETIINIARVLPADACLYVKEHKSALGDRSLRFYRQLKKYPNIKIISPTENIYSLILHSRGIITLSSTVGWEALLLKKPVMVLGNVFYNDTGLTFPVSSYAELLDKVQQILNNTLPLVDNQYDLKLAYFLDCMLANSAPFEFNVYKLDIRRKLLRERNVTSCADYLLSLCI
jgi:uncharacterized pyridoxamine 5'-phosphate oxidase family protein